MVQNGLVRLGAAGGSIVESSVSQVSVSADVMQQLDDVEELSVNSQQRSHNDCVCEMTSDCDCLS